MYDKKSRKQHSLFIDENESLIIEKQYKLIKNQITVAERINLFN